MYLFLHVLFLIVTRTRSASEGPSKKSCNVVPKDPYVQVGSDIQITCESFCVHDKVYWTLNNKVVDESWSSVINSTHNIVTLKNFTLHKAIVQCHREHTREILGGITLRTYSKPSKVGCIWHYRNDSLAGVPQLFTCTWEHHVHFPWRINYTVFISRPHTSQKLEICFSQQEKSCTSQDVDRRGVVKLLGNQSVSIRAKTKYWEIYSDPYEFNPRHILQIRRPKLKVQAFSGHLLAEWNASTTSDKHHCQVKYNQVGGKGKSEVLNVTLEPGEKGNISMEIVQSCTYYKVSVRCAWDKAPWSEWSPEESVLSQLKKKDVKLRLWRTLTGPDENGSRKLDAMWMEIPSACQGTFTYFIQQTVYKDHGLQVDSHPYISCGSSTCTIIVNQEAYRVKLRVFHNEAFLAEDSVYVPAAGETGLPQVTNIQTSTNKGFILVSWDAPSQPVRAYMIDWTHDGHRFYWTETNFTRTTLSGLLDKMAYNITVTPLFGDKTGLGAQALQICSRVAAAANISTINVDVSDQSALVSWEMERQDVCSGVIVHYIVFYGTRPGPKLNVTVDATKRAILLKDLIPLTQYSMYVKAVAQSGASKSNVRHFKTKRFDPTFVKKLCVMGSIITVLVLSAGLCCAIQYRKFLKKPLPNPGLSSIALWPSGGCQKGMFPFRLFNYPSESLCAGVYVEESRLTSTPDSNREEYGGHAFISKSDAQQRPDEHQETLTGSPFRDRTLLLSEDSAQLSPYRSQGSVQSPTQSTGKECQCLLPVQHQQSLDLYVTVDMFEQDQGR